MRTVATAAMILTLVGVVHSGQTLAGDPIFVNSGQSLANELTYHVAAADLDGDLDIDVLAGDAGFNKVWLNDGTGQFSPGFFFGNPTADHRRVALADLDGNDTIDAVIAAQDAANIVWWNDGDAEFTAGPGLGVLSRGVALGDLNGDSEIDIYLTGSGTDHIWWNNGDGTFTDSGQNLESDEGYDVTLEDLDGDGDLDVFVANGGGAGAWNTVWINQGGDQGGTEGDFLDSGQQLGFSWTEDAAVGELNAAPGPDVFVANWFPNANQVWLNDGSANFADSGQSLGMAASLGVSLGDVDGDGDLDALVGNNNPDAAKLWLNDGLGNFTDSGQSISSGSVYGSVLADFDGQGGLDLFLARFGPNEVWFNAGSSVPTDGFQPQIADGRQRAGQSTSLALDAGGDPHVAYTRYQLHRNGLDNGIWYAHWDGVAWQRVLVELAGSIDNDDPYDPYAVALALGSSGEPHIAYITEDDVNYARRMGDVWSHEELAAGKSYDNRVAMTLDSQDRPHIVYRVVAAGQLVYHHFDGAMWVSQIIDMAVTNDAFPDITVDSGDDPYVSYYKETDHSIRYAHKVGGMWQSDVVDTHAQGQDQPFKVIEIDDGGNPAIAYIWNGNKDLNLARWNGASWDLETVRTEAGAFDLEDRIGLDFDSAGNPHIVFAAESFNTLRLTGAQWDGSQWLFRVIENSPSAGHSLSMKLDAGDDLHLSYYDATHGDLRYTAFGPDFQFTTVDGAANVETTTLGLRPSTPSIGFYDVNSGLVEVAEWSGEWLFDSFDFSASPVPDMASVSHIDKQHFSHYDADNQRLIYTRWSGMVDSSVIVDETGDVGRYNDITFVGGDDDMIRIAYWDASNQWIRLAAIDFGNPPVLNVNDQAPALDADSGFVSIAPLPGLDVGISYYDGVNGDLRFAAWDSDTNTWADHQVDGAASEAGRMNDISVDATDGTAVMAYYDETAGEIRLAHGIAAPFTVEMVADNVTAVTGLSLSLLQNSRSRARILYSTAGGNLHLATRNEGMWRVVNLMESAAGALSATSLLLEDHLRFSYADSVDGLRYGFRTSNIDFAELPGQQPRLGDGFYNPMDGCIAVFMLFLGGDDQPLDGPGTVTKHVRSLRGLMAPLTDPGVFDAMAALFSIREAGHFYHDLYVTHGAEMGQIALDDPVLAWDAYGVLQNHMAGLEALVTGTGDELLIDQGMADAALDLWQRIAAAGSPGLANDINAELAKYNNLQDFVGMSFDEWAEAIGVGTPATVDMLFREGFE